MLIHKVVKVTNPNNQLSTRGFIGVSDLVVEVISARFEPNEEPLIIEYIDFGYVVSGVEKYIGRAYYSNGKAICNYGRVKREYVGELNEYNYADMTLLFYIEASTISVITTEYGLMIHSYEYPEIMKYLVFRDDSDNTTAIFDISFEVDPLINYTNNLTMNRIDYKRQYKNELNEWVDVDVDFVTISDYSFVSLLEHTLPYLADESYPTRILLKDIFGHQVIAYDTLPTSAIVMTWGKDGAGFGKRWEQGAVDIQGDVFKNDILQPTIYMKKPSDPNPDNMEDGDVLIVYNDVEAFSSANFPQEFGTGYVWGQTGVWPTLYAYWTSMSSSSNPMIESFECSAFKGDGYPILMFDGVKSTDPGAHANGFFIPLESAPVTIVFKFKGKVQFNSFALNGWGQDHEIKNSPKSFVFFGSNDGHTWDTLYDTTSFEDSWKTTKTANMLNSGNYYEYLKMVFRSNQDDNAGVNGSMIAIGELSFNCSGYKYV